MTLWKTSVTLKDLNSRNENTIHSCLGIEFTDIGDDYLEATMPVDKRTWQPAGLLHGGASAVLAESLGSVASTLLIQGENKLCVGIEINASHLRGIRNGKVVGRVTPIRIGHSLHVWDIKIRESSDLNSPLICQSRLTVMVKIS